MLPQVNYRVPNMRFLRDKLVVRTPQAPQLCRERVFKPPQLGWSQPRCRWLRSGGPALMQHPYLAGGGSQERDDFLQLYPVLQKPDV